MRKLRCEHVRRAKYSNCKTEQPAHMMPHSENLRGDKTSYITARKIRRSSSRSRKAEQCVSLQAQCTSTSSSTSTDSDQYKRPTSLNKGHTHTHTHFHSIFPKILTWYCSLFRLKVKFKYCVYLIHHVRFYWLEMHIL